jgi:tRNA A37 threonylcarbamoyladenosine modification protein TsaB
MYKIKIDATKRREKKVSLVDIEKGREKVMAEKKGDIDIVSSIRELLIEQNIPLENIDEFLSDLGPGSFTGLKIGATIANVLNWALGRKTIKELDIPEYGRDPNITLKKF